MWVCGCDGAKPAKWCVSIQVPLRGTVSKPGVLGYSPPFPSGMLLVRPIGPLSCCNSYRPTSLSFARSRVRWMSCVPGRTIFLSFWTFSCLVSAWVPDFVSVRAWPPVQFSVCECIRPRSFSSCSTFPPLNGEGPAKYGKANGTTNHSGLWEFVCG